MVTPRQIKNWLDQLGLKPRLLLLGFVDEKVDKLLKEVGVAVSVINNPRVELAEIWRRLHKTDAIVVLPSFDGVQRLKVIEAFGGKAIASCENQGEASDEILELLQDLVTAAEPDSGRKPSEKKQLTQGHHTPKGYPGYNDLCDAICELPAVTRVRYFKYAGRDLEVVSWPSDESNPDSKLDLRVRTTERCGLLVGIICDHPVHLEAIKGEIEDLLQQYRR